MHSRTAQIVLRTALVRLIPTRFVRRKRDPFACGSLAAVAMTGRIAVFGMFLGASVLSTFAGEIKNSADCDAATDALIAQFLDKTWPTDAHDNITREIQLTQVYCEEKKYSQVPQSLKFIERLMKQNRP